MGCGLAALQSQSTEQELLAFTVRIVRFGLQVNISRKPPPMTAKLLSKGSWGRSDLCWAEPRTAWHLGKPRLRAPGLVPLSTVMNAWPARGVMRGAVQEGLAELQAAGNIRRRATMART